MRCMSKPQVAISSVASAAVSCIVDVTVPLHPMGTCAQVGTGTVEAAAAGCTKQPAHAPHVLRQRQVRQHHALGPPRAARREQDEGWVGRRGLGQGMLHCAGLALLRPPLLQHQHLHQGTARRTAQVIAVRWTAAERLAKPGAAAPCKAPGLPPRTSQRVLVKRARLAARSANRVCATSTRGCASSM